MKATRHMILLLAGALLTSCEKPRPEVQPPTPEPTPVVRLTPEGTLLVVNAFSVPMADGLHGFPVGREVSILSEDDVNFTVTDGEATGVAPKGNFTNDLDEMDAVLQRRQSDAEQVQMRRESKVKEMSHKTRIAEIEREMNVRARTLQSVKESIARLYRQSRELEDKWSGRFDLTVRRPSTPEQKARLDQIEAIRDKIAQLAEQKAALEALQRADQQRINELSFAAQE